MIKSENITKSLLGIFIIFLLWFSVEKIVNSGATSFFPTIKNTLLRLISLLRGGIQFMNISVSVYLDG